MNIVTFTLQILQFLIFSTNNLFRLLKTEVIKTEIENKNRCGTTSDCGIARRVVQEEPER